ncbi:hypothetical protein [Streptomyces sp. AC555_RSS877]|uniref:hypothetical protein n=1 Tax=Streptomyces sp. AC555_RSS877 TaxID=2823688 RepID=UPI001C2586A7|nr:hypothetical protein [Streptomyces sp. AC555_RSS877]
MASDGWEWIKDQPRSWEAPELLSTPTASPDLNLGVQVIGSNIVGNDVVLVAAEYMAAHARLELWMGRHEPPLTLRRKFEIGHAGSEALRLAYEAWVEFETAYHASGRKVDQVRDERERLKAALREATETLVRARSDEVD